MIVDQLARSTLYSGVAKQIQLAFDFLNRPDLATLAVGKYPLAGDDVFALVQEYETKHAKDAKWEAHRKYLDVQYVVSGAERMGYAYLGALQVTQTYDETGDFLLLTGQGADFVMTPGMFAILFPHDAHRPSVAVDQPEKVRKVVVKVRVG